MPVWAGILLLLAMVAFRSVKLHLGVTLRSRKNLQRFTAAAQRAVLRWRSPFAERTAIELSVGGVVVPVAFAIFALVHEPTRLIQLLVASILVAGVAEFTRSLPARSAATFLSALMPPATALLLGWAWGAEQRAALAYVSGLAGILIGADVLHLRDLDNIGRPELVIGGAESFDAIFVNQLFSLFLT